MRKILRHMLLILALAVGVIVIAFAPFILLTPRAPPPPEGLETVAELEVYFGVLTANETPPALDIVVSKRGSLVYSKAFGRSDGPAKRLAASGDVYHYWSITKLFTATAVMQLADDGKLALDDPVRRYLPGFTAVAPSGEAVDITIRQLLGHTSGMRDLRPLDLAGWIRHHGDPPVDQVELVRARMQSYGKLAAPPGTASAYSNAGYIVLGAIVEVAAGQPYEEVVRSRILRPLGMASTDFVYRGDLLPRAAAGSHPLFHYFTPLLLAIHGDWFSNWVKKTENFRMWLSPLHTDYTGPTGLIGSGEDLARFGQVFAGGGAAGNPILKPATVAYMLNEGYGGNTGPDGDRMGIGWHWWEQAPVPFKGHGGSGPGFGAQLAIFPDQEMVVVVLANDTLIDRVALTNLIAGVFR